MYLAICINPMNSPLFGGEAYLLEERGKTGHQIDVVAWMIPDPLFNRDSFILAISGLVEPDNELRQRIEQVDPVFSGASHRFELVQTRASLQAVANKIADRLRAAR